MGSCTLLGLRSGCKPGPLRQRQADLQHLFSPRGALNSRWLVRLGCRTQSCSCCSPGSGCRPPGSSLSRQQMLNLSHSAAGGALGWTESALKGLLRLRTCGSRLLYFTWALPQPGAMQLAATDREQPNSTFPSPPQRDLRAPSPRSDRLGGRSSLGRRRAQGESVPRPCRPFPLLR